MSEYAKNFNKTRKPTPKVGRSAVKTNYASNVQSKKLLLQMKEPAVLKTAFGTRKSSLNHPSSAKKRTVVQSFDFSKQQYLTA